jgi:basic membrane protein A
MDGFVDGVAAYNQAHGTSVVALGWDAAAQDGTFTGDFEDVSKGQTTTQNLLDQGADVIMPVAGQVGEGAASAILAHGSGKLIWVDNDGYDTLPAEYRPLLLTSVLKDTGQAVVDIVADDQKGSFSSEPYVGTLANGGVGLAEYHDLAAAVSPELQSELDALKARIVSGDVQVKSVSTP